MINSKKQKHRSFLERIREKVERMKRDTLALYYAYNNPAIPFPATLFIWLTIGYLLSPIDLIPDFIPIIGLLDDLIIVPLLITASISLIPKEIWQESLLQAKLKPLNLKKSNYFIVIILFVWMLAIFGIYKLLVKKYLPSFSYV